jgi:uncharacterized protein YggE
MKTSSRLIAAIIAVLAVSITTGLLTVAPDADAQEVTPYPSRETQEKTAKEALDSNSVQMNKVISAIKQTGISESEISTSSFNIYPVYESYEDKLTGRYKQEIVGYGVSNIVLVQTSKLDNAASIIDNAVNSGVNRVDSVYFSLSSPTQQKLKDDLLEKAIINAKTRAEKALKPLNYQIIGVKYVSLDEFVIPYQTPMYKGVAMDVAESRAPTPVFSSDQEISTSAQVVFIIGSN